MGRKVIIDMTGLRYGRLVGLTFSHRGPCGHAHWHFSCDCGARVTVDGSNVRSGNTTSCGCRHREISATRLTVHGHRAGRRHGLTYRAWQAMKDCCSNPASPKFEAFGRRGIAVCLAWMANYESFLSDMGDRPIGTTLGRRDSAQGFAPGNCIWVPTPTRSARATYGWENRRSAPDPLQRPERPAPRSALASADGEVLPASRVGSPAATSAGAAFSKS